LTYIVTNTQYPDDNAGDEQGNQVGNVSIPLNCFLERSQHGKIALEVLLLLNGKMLLGLGKTNLFALKLPLSIAQLFVFLHKLLMISGSSNH
jgi:hypothetical protein